MEKMQAVRLESISGNIAVCAFLCGRSLPLMNAKAPADKSLGQNLSSAGRCGRGSGEIKSRRSSARGG